MIFLTFFLITFTEIFCKNLNPLTLTAENFTQATNGSTTLVTFFTYWCPHSRRFLPEFRKAAVLLEKEDIQFAIVNCEKNKNFCVNQKVEGYPTVRMYRFVFSFIIKIF